MQAKEIVNATFAAKFGIITGIAFFKTRTLQECLAFGTATTSVLGFYNAIYKNDLDAAGADMLAIALIGVVGNVMQHLLKMPPAVALLMAAFVVRFVGRCVEEIQHNIEHNQHHRAQP
jgi:uncharacterized membrane protein YjjB (DUF3815 family)